MPENYLLKILIGDEHPVVREGIKRVLADTYEILIADDASNTQEVLAKLSQKKYDLVSLEIEIPGKSWLQTISAIRNLDKGVPVLVFSSYPENEYAVRALRAGASGYLLKSCSAEELSATVKHVVSGRKYVSCDLAERLASNLDMTWERSPHELLSEREFEVFCMVASGKSLTEIGNRLCLSVKTISTYRSRVLEKMALKNNTDIIRYALKNRLI